MCYGMIDFRMVESIAGELCELARTFPMLIGKPV
jgi:hypothetical protein